jgi:spore maturation protein CgeB
MVISEEMGDTTPFVPGRHFGQAGLDGLADLVEYYLGHDSERQAVVREALQFITRELTFRDSVTRILDSCSSQRPPGSGGCPTR